MATDTRALPAFIGTDAEFRTWGSGLAAQLLAMGLVQTSDTGQINWTTVTRPAINTYGGYEIWRFADTLQATKPVFFKLEYGISSVADRPALRFTVGTGSNGTGTINGQIGTTWAGTIGASKTSGVTLNSYCSGSTSRLSLVTNLDPSSNTFAIRANIERPKSSSGVEQGDFIATLFATNNAGSQYQNIPFSGTVPTLYSAGSPNVGFSGTNTTAGTDVSLAPPVLVGNGKVLLGSWLVYKHVDIGELVTFTATHLGASHTFLPIGDGVGGSAYLFYGAGGGGTVESLAIMWE